MDNSTTTTATCPMQMVFHSGHCERILWYGWVASTVTEFVLSSLAIFAMAFFYESLKLVREYLNMREQKREAKKRASENSSCPKDGPNTPLAEISEKTYWERIFNQGHVLQTCLNIVQLTLAYILMLIFMTYNYWICLALTLGLGFGYFFFGWMQQEQMSEKGCC